MKQVTNLTLTAQTLSDGTILAAAGHKGSTKAVDSLSDRDLKLVDRGLVSATEESPVAPEPQKAKIDSKENAK